MIGFLRTSSHRLEIEIGDMHTDIWKNDLPTVPSGCGIGETIYLLFFMKKDGVASASSNNDNGI